MSLLLLLLMILVSSVHCRNVSYRRILHQPLFPESSYPQPDTTSLLLPPPDRSDEPFFPESGTQDQTPPPPPSSPPLPSSTTTATAAKTTTKTHTTNPTKKAAIAISIGIFVLVILSGSTLFMICRSKRNRPVEERKTEGFNGASPSRFLYIGTVDPHTTRTPDVIKHAINSSIKKTPPPQEAPRLQPEKNVNSVFELKSSLPKRAKFGPRTPPPPDLALLQSITTSQSPPPSSLLAQQVTKPPKVISTWTNFINKPPSESQFMSNGDHTEGKRPSESTSDSLFMSNGDHTEPEKPNLKPSESLYMTNGDHTEGTKPKLKPSESAYESHFMSNGDHTEVTKSKLKPLHWEKVRANSDRATAWDELNPSSFQLNEDLMESLFGCNTNKTASNESSKRPPASVAAQENRVLNPNKSQNIAILLRALNVTRDEVSQALLDGNTRALGGEVLETLMKMAPTKEEEIKLTCYKKGDASKLGSPERFLKAILDVPFAFKRIESMLYQANFDAEVKYLIKSFQTIEQASSELKNSKLFLKLLEAVLITGNRMNVGTNRGGANSFRLNTLLKLVDIKGTDGKTTLLHFVVKEIGLVTVTGLGREVRSIKLAAALDSDVLHSSVLKLETGLKKVRKVFECEGSSMEGKFFESMKAFHGKAEEDILRVKESERKALDFVREVSEYFHGDVVKEETRGLGIFVIVRDFLSMLDFVCKDMGIMQDRSFLIPSNVRQYDSSSEESSSP